MNTCWKCEYDCSHSGTPLVRPEDAARFQAALDRFAKRKRIDWSKVASTEDLILVLSTLFGEATVEPDSAEAKKLERFLC